MPTGKSSISSKYVPCYPRSYNEMIHIHIGSQSIKFHLSIIFFIIINIHINLNVCINLLSLLLFSRFFFLHYSHNDYQSNFLVEYATIDKNSIVRDHHLNWFGLKNELTFVYFFPSSFSAAARHVNSLDDSIFKAISAILF